MDQEIEVDFGDNAQLSLDVSRDILKKWNPLEKSLEVKETEDGSGRIVIAIHNFEIIIDELQAVELMQNFAERFGCRISQISHVEQFHP